MIATRLTRHGWRIDDATLNLRFTRADVHGVARTFAAGRVPEEAMIESEVTPYIDRVPTLAGLDSGLFDSEPPARRTPGN